MSNVIECRLRPVKEKEKKERLGAYHGSYFWDVPGFGREKWMLALTLEGVDIDKQISSGLAEEEIVEGCLNFLNTPVGKRKKKKPYGNLELYRSPNPSWVEGKYKPRFTVHEVDGVKYFTLLAVTDQIKNKHFYGKGKKAPFSSSRKRAKTKK
tara:strand:+ start:8571 stop:9029 length:459 start_codon:yes stop_codon:yes gene_type:complete